MKKKPNYDIFSRYINNQTTADENKLIDDWYAQYLHDVSTQFHKVDWSRAVNRIERINVSNNNNRSIYFSYLKVASVFLVLLSSIFLVYKLKSNFNSSNPLKNVYAHRNDGYVERNGVKMPLTINDSVFTITEDYFDSLHIEANESISDTMIIRGPSGQNFLVSLPDGSEIVLNGHSEIRIPSSFPKRNRNVTLLGEAKFKIKKQGDGDAKFSVKFCDHTIEVLGTEFNIQSGDRASEIQVALLSGVVKLSNSTNTYSIRLNKGDNYIYNKILKQYNVHNDEKQNDKNIAWVNEDFQFDRTPFANMCSILSDWYKFDIHLGESIKNEETFTGLLSRSKNLSDVLNIININNQYIYNINMEERRIIIDKK